MNKSGNLSVLLTRNITFVISFFCFSAHQSPFEKGTTLKGKKSIQAVSHFASHS